LVRFLIASFPGLILNEGHGRAMDFYLQRLRDDIGKTLEGLTDQQLMYHPEGKWSTAEILEHLYLTYTGTIKGFERCLAAGKPLARSRTLKDHLQCLVVIGCGYLPTGRKSPAGAAPKGLPPAQVRTEILSRLAEMDAIIERTTQVYGREVRLLDHPIIGPLRGPEWCKFHWLHGRHHIRQIERLRESAPSLVDALPTPPPR
jgi:hypothetical protein